MEQLNAKGGKVMFVGSSDKVLSQIKERIARELPRLEAVTLSPPYKETFSDEDNAALIKAINEAAPDLLWIGLTAPKQEKWITRHWDQLNINCHCGTIGAVFDFYAGSKKRAPLFWQRHGIEWLHRLITEPRRLWRRYLFGNVIFLFHILAEKLRG
jgi:N-acetylglucosaminyldiphosphoundecaprenol N-acetyl-beta-D-mannosaminyltransferase